MSKSIGTRLTDEAVKEVDRIAKEIGMTRSNVIAWFVLHGIKHEQDIFKLHRELKAKP